MSTKAKSKNAQVNENKNEVKTSNIEQINLKAMLKEVRQAKKEVATSKTMKVQIMEETENGYTFKAEDRKMGLIRENRPIKDCVVTGFLQIIANNKYDKTQSIVTAEATELIEKYNLVDLEGNVITAKEAKDYLIVLDGQHRTKAFAKLNAIKTSENQVAIPNVHIKTGLKNVREYLADINMVGRNWSTADKICVSAIASSSKLLDKANELIRMEFSPSTAITICTGKRITMSQLKNIIVKGDKSCLPDETIVLARAEKFLTTAFAITGMEVKILKKRYFINGFNSFAAAHTDDKAFEALEKLTIDDFGKEITDDKDFVEKLKAILQPAA